MSARHSRAGVVLAVVFVALMASITLRDWQHERALEQPIPAELTDIAPIRLARPDALIVSARLRDLPADLLRVPLLKTLLTEDFVFYYDEGETALGLTGTLRRIAYEHELTLKDEVVALALDEPADVALWRGTNGRLKHWLLEAKRAQWVDLLALAARVAGHDVQLSEAGHLPSADGREVVLYQLKYGHDHTLYFAGHGDKLVAFSDRGLLDDEAYGSAAEKSPVWKALLDERWQASPLRRHFGLGDFAGKHALVVGADAVSFQYQNLFPDVEALRFDFDGAHWDSYVRLAGDASLAQRLDTKALWAAAPADAGLCAAAPIRWPLLKPAFDTLQHGDSGIDAALLEQLRGPVGICWYASANLYSPLLLVPVAGAAPKAQLGALFKRAIGNSWLADRGIDAPLDEPEQSGSALIWRAQVKTDFGQYDVALAWREGWLVFSPDAHLVEATLAVLDQRRPAMADTLPAGDAYVFSIVAPHALAPLLTRAVDGDLPADAEPLFRGTAQQILDPRLAAAGEFPAYAVQLGAAPRTAVRAWQKLQWQALPGAH